MKNDTEGHKNGIKNENTVSDTIKKNLELNKKKKIKSEKEETLKDMLKEVDNEAKREEIIHMLLEQKVSKVIKEEELIIGIATSTKPILIRNKENTWNYIIVPIMKK